MSSSMLGKHSTTKWQPQPKDLQFFMFLPLVAIQAWKVSAGSQAWIVCGRVSGIITTWCLPKPLRASRGQTLAHRWGLHLVQAVRLLLGGSEVTAFSGSAQPFRLPREAHKDGVRDHSNFPAWTCHWGFLPILLSTCPHYVLKWHSSHGAEKMMLWNAEGPPSCLHLLCAIMSKCTPWLVCVLLINWTGWA
jgi:hypothetical protein